MSYVRAFHVLVSCIFRIPTSSDHLSRNNDISLYAGNLSGMFNLEDAEVYLVQKFVCLYRSLWGVRVVGNKSQCSEFHS